MCSVGLALAGLTTGLQMAGQYQQSRAQAASLEAQSEAAKAQADAAYQNARIQNRKGEQVAEQYAQQQQALDNKRRLIVGQQVAQAGASGIAGGIGSSLDIYNATNEAYQQDSLNLLNNQRNATYDNYVQEVNLRNQGNAYSTQATNLSAQASAAKSAGNMAMFTTLLSGAASMYGMKGAGGASATGTEQAAAAQTAPDQLVWGNHLGASAPVVQAGTAPAGAYISSMGLGTPAFATSGWALDDAFSSSGWINGRDRKIGLSQFGGAKPIVSAGRNPY